VGSGRECPARRDTGREPGAALVSPASAGWQSAGCEQPFLGDRHGADLLVTSGQEAPAPLATCSEIPRADRGNKKGFAEPQHPALSRPTDLCGGACTQESK